MTINDLTTQIFTGQIMTRVTAKEEVGDKVIEECKVLVPKAIANGRVIKQDLADAKLKKVIEDNRITKKGDIVCKLSTPYDAVYIEEEDEGLVVPSFCALIRGIDEEKADPRFITAYINTEYVTEGLKSKVAGSVMPMIKLSDVKKVELPNIPVEKQRLLGEAYSISCKKQDALKQMLLNEEKIMSNLILKAVKESK